MIRLVFILVLTVNWAFAQEVDSLALDSLVVDTSAIELPNADTIPQGRRIKISKDSLESRVEYGARDSMRFDNINSLIYLYGEAFVKYEGLSLTAAFIEVNIDSSIAYAEARKDSTGRLIGIPEFVDGGQSFQATRMRYNFESKKGLVYEAVTQESDIYVRGTKTKYVSGDDSLATDDMIFNKNAIFTTCNHPEPHYGVRSLKQKLVPNKLVVVGPSVVEIANVPTPLVLPFAFFPLTKGKRAGLILPRDYEFSEQWGFGLRDIGYYIPINDYMDARLMGDIYFNGSWGASVASQYRKKYKYSGNLRVAFSERRSELRNDYREEVQRSFRINWNHSQNNKANPYHNFSGNVDFQLNQFDQLNNNDAQLATNNSIRSTITYRRLFPDQPFSLTVGLNHSQNNNTRDVSITLPDVKFNVRRIQPFKRQRDIAEDRWYDEIGVTYNLALKNRYQTKDTLLQQGFDINSLDYGVKHTVGMNANYTVFKYLLFNTSVNYDELWHFRRRQTELNNDTIFTEDSVGVDPNGNTIFERDTVYGELQTDTLQMFTPFRSVSMNTGFSTKLFGTARFKRGKIRGIRHILTPSVSFRYAPSTQVDPYILTHDTDTRVEFNESEEYSRFLSNAVGLPSLSEEQLSLNFRLENNLEAKVFSKKDSTEKKIRLLDKLSIFTDYNIARETLKWSPVSMSTFAKILYGTTTLSLGAQFDPYMKEYDESGNGTRVERTAWAEMRRPLRFEQMDVGLATIFTVGEIARIFKKEEEVQASNVSQDAAQEGLRPRKKTKKQPESLLDIFSNFRVSHTLNFRLEDAQEGDTLLISNHFVNIRGSLKISPNWAINFGNIGYNFSRDQLQYPDVGFSRDLHCWTLDFRWQPTRGTYSMFIGVKPGSMDFLKLPYRKNNVDTFFN